MIQPGAPETHRSPIDWSSAGQLAASSLAVLGFLGLALIQAANGLFSLVSRQTLAADLLSTFTSAWSQALVGVLIIPSAVLALLRLIGRPLPEWRFNTIKGEHPAAGQRFWIRAGLWSILAWPLVIVAGYLVSQQDTWNWLILPPLSLAAIALPVTWLVAFACRGLPRTSLQRAWGTLASGLVAAPFLATVLEVAVVIFAVVVWMIWLAANPQSGQDIQLLAQRLANARNDVEAIQRLLSPYLSQPAVITTVLVIIAGFTPLIEELCKPVAVWFLLRRMQTPVEGFIAGVVSGAGFTLVESLSKTGSFTGAEWVGVTLTRAGTDLLHIVTCGLVGWALVAAWRKGRFLHLAGAYLLAVTLHGAWNALSVWIGFDAVINPPDVGQLSTLFAPLGLGLLAVVMFIILAGSNRRLRAANKQTEGNMDVVNRLPD